MLTDGSKRMSADEYTPNSTSYDQVSFRKFSIFGSLQIFKKKNQSQPNIIVPPDSPLSEAIKRARLPIDSGDKYLIKRDPGKTSVFFFHFSSKLLKNLITKLLGTIMSSDPSAPIISDVTDDKVENQV